jgi:hypothetical protein
MLDDACIVMLSDAKKEERRHGKMLVQDPESGKKPTPDPGSRWMGQKRQRSRSQHGYTILKAWNMNVTPYHKYVDGLLEEEDPIVGYEKHHGGLVA